MSVAFNKAKDKLDLDDILGFGKYSNETVNFVLGTDPAYIKYLIDKGICRFKPMVLDLLYTLPKQEFEAQDFDDIPF
jgi:hypothetical protein